MSKGRDDLAKAALLERKQIEEVVEAMLHQQAAADDTLAQLNNEISQLQEKLQDAKSRQSALVMRHKTASSRLKVREQLYSNDIDSAMERFEGFERKLDNLEASVESQGLGRKRTLAEEIDSLEDDEKLEAELAELKKKVSGEKSPAKASKESKDD